MKKKFLLFCAALGIAYIGLTGYASGPAASPAALNRTGAAGSTANCSTGGCHSASSSSTTAVIEMADPASPSVKVTKYIPGKTYLMTIRGISTPAKPKFGFQVAATKSDNSNAGTLTATAASTGTHAISGINIIEHRAALAASPSAGNYTVNFNWTAPVAGSGTITFYGIINAVDGTGTTANDLPSNGTTAAFSEDLTSSVGTIGTVMATNVYPNPCTDMLHIEARGNMRVSVSDLGGRQLINTTAQKDIDVSGLQPGSYIIRLDNGTEQQVSMFIKK
ncbi:MAG: T9SS type A sorting domain-containing protein [Chitinophagaceae bacterium]|nr:T9SS type A sorting domain-containing protein [Chitinophagaceae bacterium]